MVTFKRTSNGHFEVFVNGTLSAWRIFNGSLGLSGHTRNMYGISNETTGKVRWIGPLNTCKQLLTRELK